MWLYQKKLEYPVRIKNPNPRLAKFIISQYGGPDGEIGAVGTEELAHLEMVSSMVHQLTDGVCPEDLEKAGLGAYFTDHGWGTYPQAASGTPFSAATLQVTSDPVTDLTEDLAAEQKARSTYEKLIDLCADDPDVLDPLRFLREREVVHFQRFGEALNGVQEKLAQKKFYQSFN